MSIHKGDQYAIPIDITIGTGETAEKVTPENIDALTVKISDIVKKYPGDITWDSDEEQWLFPITETETDHLFAIATNYQCRIKRGNDILLSDIEKVTVSESIICISD